MPDTVGLMLAWPGNRTVGAIKRPKETLETERSPRRTKQVRSISDTRTAGASHPETVEELVMVGGIGEGECFGAGPVPGRIEEFWDTVVFI